MKKYSFPLSVALSCHASYEIAYHDLQEARRLIRKALKRLTSKDEADLQKTHRTIKRMIRKIEAAVENDQREVYFDTVMEEQ